MAISGSVKKVTLDGVTFYIKADSDPSHVGDFETEGIRHSGGTLMKKTLAVANIESVDLVVDAVDEQNLRDLADRTDNFSMSITYSDDSIKTAAGQINIDSSTAQENTLTIMMIPDGKWDIFSS